MVPSFNFSYRSHVVQRTLIFYVAEQGLAEWGEFLCDVTSCFERLVLLPGRSGHLAGKQTNPALHPHKVSSLQEAACVSLYRNTALKRPSGDGMRCPWPWCWSSETPSPFSKPNLPSSNFPNKKGPFPRKTSWMAIKLLYLWDFLLPGGSLVFQTGPSYVQICWVAHLSHLILCHKNKGGWNFSLSPHRPQD